jgi:O-antigen/teichoic acid export membrane protein
VGIYSQASKFAQLLWIIPGILAGLIIPALKNENQKLDEGVMLSLCRVSFYIHIILSFVVIAISLAIYLLFLPGIYFDGFFSLLVMIPGYLLFTTAIILAAYFSANRLLQVNLIGAVLCCIIIVLLDLLLIPAFSYKGAAIANLIAYSVTTAYFLYRSKQYLEVPFKKFFAIKRSDFNLFSERVTKNFQNK